MLWLWICMGDPWYATWTQAGLSISGWVAWARVYDNESPKRIYSMTPGLLLDDVSNYQLITLIIRQKLCIIFWGFMYMS